MIPYDAVIAETFLACVREWRKPAWAAIAPFPGLAAARLAWESAAPIRAAIAAD